MSEEAEPTGVSVCKASQDCQSDARAGDSGVLGHHPYPSRDRVMFLLVRHEGVLFSARKSQDCR